MAKAPQMSHAERMAADTAALLTDVLEAGGSINIRFDKEHGARVRANLDRVPNACATALYLRYRHAMPELLLKAGGALILDAMKAA